MSFVAFQPDDSVVSSATLVSPMWSNTTTNLQSFYTSSGQESGLSGQYYLDVYNNNPSTAGSEVQFSIAYGDMDGYGTSPINSSVTSYSPSRVIYGEFRNLIFGDESSSFNFGGSNGVARDIIVLSVNRARFKESFNLGSLNLRLGSGSSTMYLTDNSKDTTSTTFIGTSRYYYLVSGSNGYSYNGTSVQTNSGSYGLVFPDMGLIILNPRALSLGTPAGGIGLSINQTPPASFSPVAYNTNNRSFFYSLTSTGGLYFSLQNSETMASRYFWVRIKNREFNYTTNPSVIDANGNIIYATLVDNPQTYITAIGLYNNSNELLAVAKLSKPLVKDFTKELTVRVKLDF